MDVIILYGPPASGKYTIAKEISKISHYTIFHNHDIIDLLSSILDTESNEFWPLCNKIRLDILKSAQKEEIKGMAITLAYTGHEDRFIKEIIKTVEKSNKNNVYLVKLSTEKDELQRRVYHVSRREFGKIRNKRQLNLWLKYNDPEKLYPFRESIIINTSKKTSKNCAKKILKEINN